MTDPPSLPRRLRAARALAGLKSVQELARIIDQKGLSARTLADMEAGKRPIQPRDCREIARACDLPAAFFSSDFWLLEELSEHWPTKEQLDALDLTDRDVINRAMQALAEQANSLLTAERSRDGLAEQVERLHMRLGQLEHEIRRQRAAAGLPAPPGELGRRAAEPEPTGEDQQPGRRPGEGGRSGGGDG
jgi:hypothetical protein